MMKNFEPKIRTLRNSIFRRKRSIANVDRSTVGIPLFLHSKYLEVGRRTFNKRSLPKRTFKNSNTKHRTIEYYCLNSWEVM